MLNFIMFSCLGAVIFCFILTLIKINNTFDTCDGCEKLFPIKDLELWNYGYLKMCKKCTMNWEGQDRII